jgi:hypothetical protein
MSWSSQFEVSPLLTSLTRAQIQMEPALVWRQLTLGLAATAARQGATLRSSDTMVERSGDQTRSQLVKFGKGLPQRCGVWVVINFSGVPQKPQGNC